MMVIIIYKIMYLAQRLRHTKTYYHVSYYQNRRLNIDDTVNTFENHQMKYAFDFKKITLGLGGDYLSRSQNELGGLVFIGKYISKLDIRASLSSSIFEDRLNYKAQASKYIVLNYNSLFKSLTIGLTYESFMGYRDLYFGATFIL